MKSSLLMDFSVDRENKKIRVNREFAAPLNNVWAAWTESNLLDQWWAPKPWKTRTKTMDFRDGGHWLYAMVGPDGEEHWARVDYKSVSPGEHFSARDGFSDDQGVVNTELPVSLWNNSFHEVSGDKTRVSIQISFDKLSDLESIIKMGFKEGFTAGLENLDELLANQQK